MNIQFINDGLWKENVQIAYTLRYAETPPFIQEQDHIRSGVNPDHPEGFDNVSLLTRQVYTPGITVTTHCSFSDAGCPEIILVPETALRHNGATYYGDCFELVAYRNGFNVWRHYQQGDQRSWIRRLGVEYPVSENLMHTLQLQILQDRLNIWLDGQKTTLYAEDIPQRFYVGLTACEGVARLFDFKIEE